MVCVFLGERVFPARNRELGSAAQSVLDLAPVLSVCLHKCYWSVTKVVLFRVKKELVLSMRRVYKHHLVGKNGAFIGGMSSKCQC